MPPTHLLLCVVNHNVVGLHVSVHDAPRVAELERLQQLVDVEAHIVVRELGVEHVEVQVVDVLKDQRRRVRLGEGVCVHVRTCVCVCARACVCV